MYKKFLAYYPSLVIVLFFCTTLVSAQDSETTINWTGVRGPFQFQGYSSPQQGTVWSAAGRGSVSVQTLERGDYVLERNYKLPFINSTKSFYGVWFDKRGVGWVTGEDGLILHTDNSGYSWMQQQSGTADTLSAITCVDAIYCWALGNQSLLQTKDAGKTWLEIAELDAEIIDFVDKKYGWAADYHNLYRTQNGGLTWKHLVRSKDNRADFSYLFQGVEFVDRMTGWAAGEGKVGFSSDGGKTWRVTKIDGTNFVGIASANRTSAIAVNRGKYNYCTDDSGKTWNPCGTADWAKAESK